MRPLYPATLVLAAAVGSAAPPAVATQFEDASGLLSAFSHTSLPNGDGLAGAAWLDYDNDGFVDLFLTNGKGGVNVLFHNDGGTGFTDVAAAAGVEGGVGNSGVIAADLDNDGFPDLFLTGDGGLAGSGETPVVLYRNNGDGTFSDLTASSGIVGPQTHVSAAFGDIDDDGLLDLFISALGSLATTTQHRNTLYLNKGGFQFEDISARSGVDSIRGACANFFADFNDDNMLDLLVANCNDVHFLPTPIELFLNRGDLSFSDVATVPGLKHAGYWMGVCPADFDNDGDTDVFATNFGPSIPPGTRSHALFDNNDGDTRFTDVAAAAMVDAFEFGWGCVTADVDNDGWADIFMAGSLPMGPLPVIGPGLGNPGRMLINNHDGTFSDATALMPLDLSSRFTSGVATADYDNDGFDDIVVATEEIDGDGGHPALYHNLGSSNFWLRVELEGTTANSSGVGATIELSVSGLTQRRHVMAGSSFASMNSLSTGFGLGTATSADRLQVRWPSGLVERLSNVAANQVLSLVEGQCGNDPGGCAFCGPAPLPSASCRSAAKSSLQLKRSGGVKDLYKWKWQKGEQSLLADFDNPPATRAITTVCIYDATGGASLEMQNQLPAGGVCNGKRCWKATGSRGFKYKSKSGLPQGLTRAKFRAGSVGKAQVQVRGKGAALAVPPLMLNLPVTVQMHIEREDGLTQCWGSEFASAQINTAERFKAKTP